MDEKTVEFKPLFVDGLSDRIPQIGGVNMITGIQSIKYVGGPK